MSKVESNNMAKTLSEYMAKRMKKSFVDYKQLMPLFKECLLTPRLPKRLMLIYGVGGSGKTTYLYMFENIAKDQGIPIAYVSGRGIGGIRSTVDILREWAIGLGKHNIILPIFDKTPKKYDSIRSRVELIEQENTLKVVDRNVLDGLKKDESRLFVDSTNILTKFFLVDLSKVARGTRVVLMLDDFETLSAERIWIASFARRINKNSLLIIAGRDLLDWNTEWNGWEKDTYIKELDWMSEEDARTYLRQVSIASDLKMEDAIINS